MEETKPEQGRSPESPMHPQEAARGWTQRLQQRHQRAARIDAICAQLMRRARDHDDPLHVSLRTHTKHSSAMIRWGIDHAACFAEPRGWQALAEHLGHLDAMQGPQGAVPGRQEEDANAHCLQQTRNVTPADSRAFGASLFDSWSSTHAIWWARSVFVAGIPAVAVPLLMHRQVKLRLPSSPEPLLEAFADAWEAISQDDPRDVSSLRVLRFPFAQDDARTRFFDDVQSVDAYGSDASVASLRASLRASLGASLGHERGPGLALHAFGHGLGVALLDAGAPREEIECDLRALAIDISAFDQQGCMAPQIVLVGGMDGADAVDRAQQAMVAWSRALLHHLDLLAATYPPGETDLESMWAMRAWDAEACAVAGSGDACFERSQHAAVASRVLRSPGALAALLDDERALLPTPGFRRVVMLGSAMPLRDMVSIVAARLGRHVKVWGLPKQGCSTTEEGHLFSPHHLDMGDEYSRRLGVSPKQANERKAAQDVPPHVSRALFGVFGPGRAQPSAPVRPDEACSSSADSARVGDADWRPLGWMQRPSLLAAYQSLRCRNTRQVDKSENDKEAHP